MITLVPDVLVADELAALRRGIEAARFVEGATTAGGAAREVKKNQQIPTNTKEYERLADIVRGGFVRNTTLQGALLPASVTRVMFNRYAEGMEYGPHIDIPLMGVMGNMLRTDVSMTLFLSDPDSYEGGELTIIQGGGATYRFKEQAGSAITYPSNSLHHVTPVTRGVRDAAVFWVQSLVRDPARREILWDLERAQQELYKREGRTPEFEAVNRSRANLLRMWADV